jgi:hypothetical protein
MAIKTGTVIKLADNSLGVEHSVVIGQPMLGHRPADVTPGYDTVRHILKFATPADGVMGLFDPGPHVSSHVHAFVPAVQVRQGAGVAYSIYLTNGLGVDEGSPTAPEVDDPDFDLILATGTGSAYVRTLVELLPGQMVRVVLGTAATVDSRVIVHFVNVVAPGGRLV